MSRLENRIKWLAKQPQEVQDTFFGTLDNHLRNDLNIVKQEIEDNNGKVPQHQIDEEKKLGLI